VPLTVSGDAGPFKGQTYLYAPETRAAAESGHKLTRADGAIDTVPLVSLIVVNWNGRDQLESCLRSIQSCRYPKLEVIVFDNGSTDGSQGVIRESYPFVRLIENSCNIGYALGNNRALNVAEGEYLFLVNNDATIEPDCIDQLISVASADEQAGILGCKVYVAGAREGTLEHAGGVVFPTGYTTNRGYLQHDLGQYDETRDVDYVIGAAMMISKRVTDKIGLFDVMFSLYYEDTDLCSRAKRAGFRVVYVPKAIVHHSRSATTNRVLGTFGRLMHMEKSRIYFVLKNFEAGMLLRWLLLELRMLTSMIIRPFEPKSGEHLVALFESYLWNLRVLRTLIQRRIGSPTAFSNSDLGSFRT